MSNLIAVITTGANMRQTASKDAPIVAVLDKGAQVNVLGNAGNWLRVQHDGHTGFVYIELSQPQPASAAEAAWTTTVIAQQLNLRASAARESNTLGTLAQNQQVPVIGYVGTWLWVRANDQNGFISADCTASVSALGEAVAQAQLQAFAQTIAPVGIAAPDASTVAMPAPEVQLKARLTPEEIGAVRNSIAQELDENARGDRYEELQSCVIYASQRDNQARNPDGSRVETRSGNMCNLTSLSMALSYLGIANPKPNMQYEDALELLRQERHLDDRTTAKGWGGVAQALGARVSFIGNGSVTQGHDWWDANVRRPHLRKGAGVIMSIGNHIVRVQAVTEQGVIVDDPYGRCGLLRGEAGAWKYVLYNEYDKPGQTAGEDTLWPWADVAQHTMRWVAAIAPAPMVLGDEEPLPDIEDDGVVVENNPL
jgi:SH3-like domain-containing protein